MDNNKQVSMAAGAVGSMTLVSRLFGFVRDLVIAMMFGSSAAADAFFVAFRIPNIQRRILGEGGVNAGFIPVFGEYLNTKSKKEAWELAGILLNILLVILIAVTLALMICAPLVIRVFAPGFLDEPDKFQLTVELTQLMAPYLIFIGLSAFCMGILNSYKVFALPALAPVLLNICMILSALFISPRMDQPIIGLAIGVLIGGLAQLLVQLPTTFRKGFKLVRSIKWKHPGIVKIGKLMIPALFGLAVYEIDLLVDTLLASLLPGGSISYLYYANRLVQLPLGVFGVALGIAILPMLTGQAARKEFSELAKTLSFGVRLILFISVPSTLGLIILRYPIINTLWERGEFHASSTEGTAIALMYYSIGLCAFAGSKVVISAFYSLQDTKTPVKVGIYSVILHIILSVILMGPLKHGGLALSTSLAAIFNATVLIFILKNRLGKIGGRKILTSFIKLVFAASVMSVIVYFCNEAFFNTSDPLITRLLALTGCVSAGALSFGTITYLMKNEEIIFLINLARKRKPELTP